MKQPSVLEWCRILRAHHLFTIFQAIRYALWLARYVPFVGAQVCVNGPDAVTPWRPAILILKRSEPWMHSRLFVEVTSPGSNYSRKRRRN
jgi:hypothetical protein